MYVHSYSYFKSISTVGYWILYMKGLVMVDYMACMFMCWLFTVTHYYFNPSMSIKRWNDFVTSECTKYFLLKLAYDMPPPTMHFAMHTDGYKKTNINNISRYVSM